MVKELTLSKKTIFLTSTCHTNICCEYTLNHLIKIMLGSRGDAGPDPENLKAIGFLRNTGMDPLENHLATQPAFSVGLSLARQ